MQTGRTLTTRPGQLGTGTTVPGTPPPQAQHMCTEPGWTNWMNSHIPSSSDRDDIEFLPNLIKEYAFCREDQIAYIQCRQVSNEVSYDQGVDNFTICNTKAGFACYSSLQGDRNCEDYEVRVYCQCADAGK